MSHRIYCPVRKSHYNRKTRYNLTPEAYTKLLARQKGVCAICKKPIKLAVDHSHTTSKVRGLLCTCCNSILGHAFDSVTILQSAIRYLKRNR